MNFFRSSTPGFATSCLAGSALTLLACAASPETAESGSARLASAKNPDDATVVAVDRFSDHAGHLFRRSDHPEFPAANAPVDFDQAPFITHGLGPSGEKIAYYNFDVDSDQPARIYVLFREGQSEPVAGQLNIVDVLPGDAGYNDFWQVTKVTVPADYVANSVTSLSEIMGAGFASEKTDRIVNCPVVPAGSKATHRYTATESPVLVRGWYRGQVVTYFSFLERSLTAGQNGRVPLSEIIVSFRKNPDPKDPSSGPPSGFVTEPGTEQTHNVVADLPEDSFYSPLWDVSVYDNSAFSSVTNIGTAANAPTVAQSVALVNCPVVENAALPR